MYITLNSQEKKNETIVHKRVSSVPAKRKVIKFARLSGEQPLPADFVAVFNRQRAKSVSNCLIRTQSQQAKTAA